MKTRITLAAFALLTTGLSAQQSQRGRVETDGHVDKNVRAAQNEPEDLQRGDVGAPPADAIPMPELNPDDDRALPPGFRSQAAWVDADTGLEHRVDLLGDLPGEHWIAGEAWDEEAEPAVGHRTWNADLSSVTSTAFPWSAACRIYFDDSNGSTYVCSGTMIDPSYVITAGHCVHEGSGGSWYTNFRIYPAWDGDDDAYGSSAWSSAASFTDWTVNGSFSGDMGFIRLSRPVGFLTGYMGYGTGSDSFFSGELFNLAGYPAGCYSGAPHQLYYGYGSYDVVGSAILTADIGWSCDTGGVSGTGAYWISTNSTRYVTGCHSHRCYSCSPNTIGHTRLTTGKWDYFHNTFLPGGYSTTQVDLVPMRVRVNSHNYVAGDQLDSMAYVVGNRSMHNPGQASYPVDVYLSTNDNISTADTLIQSHSFAWDFGDRSSVTVLVSNPPTIPVGTASGNYWVGIITNAANDADTSNDDTDGWDAQPITVTGCQVNFTEFGVGLAGSGRFVPTLFGTDSACQQGGHFVSVTNGLGRALGYMWMGLGQVDIPGFGGRFYVDLGGASAKFAIRLNGNRGQPGSGWITLPGADVTTWQGLTVYLQCTFLDAGAPKGVSLTPGLRVDITE